MLDVLNKSFNDAFLTKWATHYSRFGVSMTASLPYLRNRATYARNQVNTAVPTVPFSITTAGPLTVNTPTAALTGKGWVNVAEIKLEGAKSPLPVTWTAISTWSIQLPLRGGTQTYVLQALDPDGAVIATAPITITATAGPFPATTGSLIASEINYNPPELDDLTEFIELLNATSDTIDLSGCQFVEVEGEGISYVFPAGVQLAPGARLLVTRDQAAMTARYGAGLNMAPGTFVGALSNSGERLILLAANGQEIFRLRYMRSPNTPSAPATPSRPHCPAARFSPSAQIKSPPPFGRCAPMPMTSSPPPSHPPPCSQESGPPPQTRPRPAANSSSACTSACDNPGSKAQSGFESSALEPHSKIVRRDVP